MIRQQRTYRVISKEVVHTEVQLGAVHRAAVVPHAAEGKNLTIVLQELLLGIGNATNLNRRGVSKMGFHETLHRVGLLAVEASLVSTSLAHLIGVRVGGGRGEKVHNTRT